MTEFRALISTDGYTRLAELKDADTLAGLVNHADFTANNTVITRNNAGEVAALPLATNTVLANVGSGVTALPLTDLKTALQVPTRSVDSARTGAITAVASTIHPVDTRATAATISPPAVPTAGMWFTVVDAYASALSHSITVDFDGANQPHYGVLGNAVIATNGAVKTFTYINGTIGWVVQ